MSSPQDEVRITLSLIEDARLPHPSGALLSSFVKEALNPLVAARYVQDVIQAGKISSLVSRWVYIVEASECIPLCYLHGWPLIPKSHDIRIGSTAFGCRRATRHRQEGRW